MEKLTEKANTFQILTENGIEKKKAYSLAGYKGSSKKAIYEVEKRIKKHSVASPALVRLSKNAVRDTLQMLTSLQEVETAAGIKTVKVYPTHRDRLQAAAMVIERAEPAKHVSIQIPGRADGDFIDLSAYWRPAKSGEKIINVEAKTEPVGNSDIEKKDSSDIAT